MAPTRVIPPAHELRHLLAQGHTHQEIADLVYETTGIPVTRGAVSSAVSRAGMSAQGKRYTDTLPWRVKIEHSKHYAARMLRLLGRRRAGEVLHEQDGQRLDSWLEKMDAEGTVVAYIPETAEGFHYMDPPVGYVMHNNVPIIRQTISLDDIGTTVVW